MTAAHSSAEANARSARTRPAEECRMAFSLSQVAPFFGSGAISLWTFTEASTFASNEGHTGYELGPNSGKKW